MYWRFAVEHRVGHLEVGDIAVVVAVGAVHRGEALAACAHLINTLKAEVPIWKEQHFASGESEWVDFRGERRCGLIRGSRAIRPSTAPGRSDW
jgi:molybdopterin synthase catalytic subunit